MKAHVVARRLLPALLIPALLLGGCASWTAHRADALVADNQTVEGLRLYQKLAEENPQRYLVRYVNVRDREFRKLLATAETARRLQDSARALEAYRLILEHDPRHAEALRGLDLLARDGRHATLMRMARDASAAGARDHALRALGEILAESPDHAEARAMREQLQMETNRGQLAGPRLREALRRPVSLEFRDASVQAILEILAQTSGLNFLFDRDLKADVRTTIFARNTTVEDALRLVLDNAQMRMKPLNETTVLIYPATEDKLRRYDELVTRSFYLGSADPKRVLELVKAMAQPKASWADERLRMIVVRDRLEVVENIERLVAAYDIPAPEVLLDVRILEVSTDRLLNLGIQAPDTISASVYGSAKKPGELTLDELKDLGRENFRVFLPDPLAVANLQQTSGNTNTLANPRIRVKSLEKAKVMVGDKVPVITTATNDIATSESVAYLDVGLKLEVEPEVHTNNDVSITLDLEVSNIVKEIKTGSGLLTYQIGTRNANTVLRLRDGETQVLAGLIRDDERASASHVPGIGKLPVLGRLFSSRNDSYSKSEVVLLITPHILRSLHRPGADVLEFASGTEADVGARPLRLAPAGDYSSRRPAPSVASSVPAPSSAVATPAPETTSLLPALPPMPGATSPAAITTVPVPTEAQPSTSPALEAVTQAEPPAVTLAPPIVAPASPVRIDPVLAQVRLDLVLPAQIRAGQEFTAALLVAGQAAETLSFDLVFDPPGLAVLRISPIGSPASFHTEPLANGVRVIATGVTTNGPLAMFSLRADAPRDIPVIIRTDNPDARRAGDQGLLVSGILPRELRVTP